MRNRLRGRLVQLAAVVLLGLGTRDVAGQSSVLKPDEEVLLYPTVGKAVRDGWRMEIHGVVYEPERRGVMVPLIRTVTGLDEKDLTSAESEIFRERCRHFLVDHERGKKLSTVIDGKSVSFGKSGADGRFSTSIDWKAGAVAVPATGGVHTMSLPIGNSGRRASLEVHLLAESGISVISDIDDTIKISEVRDKEALLRNTFCRPFKPVPGMATVYQHWAAASGAQFHYVTASPWQLYLPLSAFVRSNGFPAGTFHMKEFRVKDRSVLSLFASPERYKRGVIEPILERFPKRQFVLVGDSGEKDPEIYGVIAREHPRQIRRILIRDVTGDAVDSRRYREAFKALPREQWWVFKDAGEIRNASGISAPEAKSR